MSADYRDELSAAHARIAELEDKVLSLETELKRPEPGTATRFPDLEAEVELARAPADEKRRNRTILTLQIGSAALAVGSAGFSYLGLPLVAAFVSALSLVSIVASLVVRFRLEPARRRLAEATERLADARRMDTLEQRLAATEARTRVELKARAPEGGDEIEAPAAASSPARRTTS